MEGLAEEALLADDTELPQPNFTKARITEDGSRLPHSIAHRGFKAKFPENTMSSMRGAVEAGAHALETDIHLTKDGVVVLSHDANLKRCFGKPEKIIDCDWEYIQSLRTIAKPYVPMPRLKELLEYLATPGLEDIWLLLDIKLDNDAADVIRLIASDIASVSLAPGTKPWNQRIVLGFWATKYLGVIFKYLPNYPISHIGFSTNYARQFFTVPNVSFNMLQAVLVGPMGSAFIKEAKQYNRSIFAWTVNEEKRMRWCINEALDGVITDDPEKFLQISKEYENVIVRQKNRGILRKKERFTIRDWFEIVRTNFFIVLFLVLFKWKFGWGIENTFIRRQVAPAEKR
ncbi:PLC-like phosphodiesterase [Venturia nashicola]|nr:PLC-like phosphodiesterase [Venturia nashicola]